jgi:hypothetical protein
VDRTKATNHTGGYYPKGRKGSPTHTHSLIAALPFFLLYSYSGSFDILDDDVMANALSVSITNYDTGETLFEAPTGAREGIFKLDSVAQSVRLALCFQNNDIGDEDDNDFDVGFSLRVNHLPRALEEGVIGPDGERALTLVKRATDIHQDWSAMLDHLDFVRNREAMHQDMNDAILSRLSRWTYIEAFLVISMATGQVMYWKKFFETRRYL